MSKNYEDWADWAGDHPEQAEAQMRAEREARSSISLNHGLALAGILPSSMDTCPHAEVDTQGVCEDCGIEVPSWEPDDAQLLTQTGTKEPSIPVEVVATQAFADGIYVTGILPTEVLGQLRNMAAFVSISGEDA